MSEVQSRRLPSTTSVVLFTRVPVPGRAKTRLEGVLSPERCAELQWAMAQDLVARLSRACPRLTVSYGDDARDLPDGDEVEARFKADLAAVADPSCDLHFSRQRGDGLGERMEAAMADEFSRGAGACLLLGSDLPGVGEGQLRAAARLLDGSDAVLCPSEDGGYWLVGLHRPCPELFSGKSYGGANVLDDAVAALDEAGLTCSLGPVVADVDTPRDLDRLYLALRSAAAERGAVGELLDAWEAQGSASAVKRSHPVRGPDGPADK